MKTILCFGDSLTWGQDPAAMRRHPYDVRWTGRLQAALGASARVIEEGLGGRTTMWDSPFAPGRNGRAMLGPLLESHAPLDLVMVMLGTNDFQPQYRVTAAQSARAAGVLAADILRSACGPEGGAPRVLLLAPPPIGKPADMMGVVFHGHEGESRKLAAALRVVAAWNKVEFFDTAEVISVSPVDGVHLDAAANAALADALAPIVRRLLA